MFFSMGIIEFELLTLAEVDLIRVKVLRLRAERRQSLRRLRCCPVKGTLRRSMLEGQMHQNSLENSGERVEMPGFISVLIESGLSTNPQERPSFDDISEALKENCFRIADGVDSNEVSAFPSFVESSEM
jgi:hypothetical protein